MALSIILTDDTKVELEEQQRSENIIYRVMWIPSSGGQYWWYTHAVTVAYGVATFKDIQDDNNPVVVSGNYYIEVVDDMEEDEDEDK